MNRKFAIVSVYDKHGVVDLGRDLVGLGYTIVSTGGTSKALTQAGVPVSSISEYTGAPEILDGRVKSLHPKIHGGILARRDLKGDLAELDTQGISPIDLVVVNLYPFVDKCNEAVSNGASPHTTLEEFIDIGGPTMIRAAAKNCRFVIPLIDPADYPLVLGQLKDKGEVPLETRRYLASKVFASMAAYDQTISRYFSLGEQLLDEHGEVKNLAPLEGFALEKVQELRYGENPHQHAGFYRRRGVGGISKTPLWKKRQGKELSYNNLLDLQGALDLLLDLHDAHRDQHSAVVIKHSNPCGAAVRDTAVTAFEAARACDPVSAFGGIVAISSEVDRELAESINEGFVEVLAAGSFTEGALEVLARKKSMRVLECDYYALQEIRRTEPLVARSFFDGFLMQSPDLQTARISSGISDYKVVSEKSPSQELLVDLNFAWIVSKHVKSNAIVLAKDLTAIGIGAGQMSRVDAARLAVERAHCHGHTVTGSAGASDAFLPFPDTLEVISASGAIALVQPGGSIKDEEVISEANRLGVAMVFTGERHFRH